MTKLKIVVYNEKKEKIFCRVVLRENPKEQVTEKRKYFEGYYCDGGIEIEGLTESCFIEIYKGKFFQPYKKYVDIYDNSDSETNIFLEVTLKSILNPRDLGLYSFDAHSHISRNKLEPSETSNLIKASCIMKAEDYDFFFAGSPYDLDTHYQTMNGIHTDTISYRAKYALDIKEVSDESFILDIGNEIVKGRYGHVFMVNYTQMPPFDKYYDESYDKWQFTKNGTEPEYKMPYMHEALNKEKDKNSAAVLAHPTSWWYEDGEFITNIAATLGFELLTGTIDAIVIMGYSKIGDWYEKLWYEVLDCGFFLPGVSELDIILDDLPRGYDAYKTYVYCEAFKKDSLADGIKKGLCIATSGPILELRVNDKLPGSVLTYKNNEQFIAEIKGYECYESSLSNVQLIVNGKVYSEYSSKTLRSTINETLVIKKDSYIIAKCWDEKGNIAITNPIYIRNNPFVNEGFKSDVTIVVKSCGKKIEGIYKLGDSIEEIAFNKEIRVKISPDIPIHIFYEGKQKTIKLFELDRLQKIIKNLYLGKFNKTKKYTPGQVPPEAFGLKKILKLLKKVKIKIVI